MSSSWNVTATDVDHFSQMSATSFLQPPSPTPPGQERQERHELLNRPDVQQILPHLAPAPAAMGEVPPFKRYAKLTIAVDS
ncbi:unnamed protein product, partial [Amoebophrya sp. A25]|eukprot:GSA25T00023834001.1